MCECEGECVCVCGHINLPIILPVINSRSVGFSEEDKPPIIKGLTFKERW